MPAAYGTPAELARELGITREAVTQAAQAGRLVTAPAAPDLPDSADTMAAATRAADLAERLRALAEEAHALAWQLAQARPATHAATAQATAATARELAQALADAVPQLKAARRLANTAAHALRLLVP